MFKFTINLIMPATLRALSHRGRARDLLPCATPWSPILRQPGAWGHCTSSRLVELRPHQERPMTKNTDQIVLILPTLLICIGIL